MNKSFDYNKFIIQEKNKEKLKQQMKEYNKQYYINKKLKTSNNKNILINSI